MSIFRGPAGPEKSPDEPEPESAPDERREPRPSPKPEPPSAAGSRSYLGPGCVFEGEIRGSGSLECHGTVEGIIELDGDIVIGERGSAKADLVGARIVVDGSLRGDARGSVKVEVGATGQVHGDIRAPAVGFGEGALFEGNVEMRSEGGDSTG